MQLNSRGELGQNPAQNSDLEEDALKKGNKRVGDRLSKNQRKRAMTEIGDPVERDNMQSPREE